MWNTKQETQRNAKRNWQNYNHSELCLSKINRSSGQKIYQEYDLTNKLSLVDRHRTLCLTAFFSNTVLQTGHISSYKRITKKFQRAEFTQLTFTDHKAIKLENNNGQFF